jgi:hypothetical protein
MVRPWGEAVYVLGRRAAPSDDPPPLFDFAAALRTATLSANCPTVLLPPIQITNNQHTALIQLSTLHSQHMPLLNAPLGRPLPRCCRRCFVPLLACCFIGYLANNNRTGRVSARAKSPREGSGI